MSAAVATRRRGGSCRTSSLPPASDTLDGRVLVAGNRRESWLRRELGNVEGVVVRAPADPHARPLELVRVGLRPAPRERADRRVEVPEDAVEVDARAVGDDRPVEDVRELREARVGQQQPELELGVPRCLVEVRRRRRVEPPSRHPGVGDVVPGDGRGQRSSSRGEGISSSSTLKIHSHRHDPKSHAIGLSPGWVGGNDRTTSATPATAACVSTARGSSTATTISSAIGAKSARIAASRSGLRPLLRQATERPCDGAAATQPS